MPKMSRYASELCILLVEDVYGELTSRIFRTLLLHGRLSIPALLYYTRLSARLIKHGLAVLVQQQLVFWYTSTEDLAVYEVNTAVAFNLVRSGKYVYIAEEQLGKFAGAVISDLLLLGHARVDDLVQAYGVGEKESAKAPPAVIHASPIEIPPNGSIQAEKHAGDSRLTLESVHMTLFGLLRVGLVSLVNESHFRSDTDNRSEAGKLVPPPEAFKCKNKRDNEAEREVAIQQRLEGWKHGTGAVQEEVPISSKGKKRHLEEPDSSETEKRRRLYLPLEEQTASTPSSTYALRRGVTQRLDNDLVLRINHAKFAVIMRHRSLVELVDQSICTSTSKVYAEALRRLEPSIRDCKEERETPDFGNGPDLSALPQVTTDEIVAAMSDSAEMANALGTLGPSKSDMSQMAHPKKRRKKKEQDSEDDAMVDGDASPNEDEDDSDSGDSLACVSDADEVNGEAEYKHNGASKVFEDPHRDTIRDHLLLLAQHPYHFLHHFPQTPVLPERWTIHYTALVKRMTHHMLLQTITSRYGLPAARITRLLSEKGKVDEKNLCSLSLLNQKLMRSYLATLNKAGMIQLQEVPRDNSRNPQRTMYLWFFDVERCKAKLLQETYKTMARCLQRVQVEGVKVKSTVEKASRSDVIGKEKELLGVQEREALSTWRGVEEKIWAEVGRLDDMVAIMRDF